jgi:integrase
VVDKLRDLHEELDKGIVPKTGYVHYTVRQAADDWLATGLGGRSAKTVKKNQNVLEPILNVIGARKLRELTAADVRHALATMAARYSGAAVTRGHLALKRAIRHAEANDLVSRNVAALVDTPRGQDGRPSRSLTLEQAVAVITARTLPVGELRPGLKDVRRPAELMYAYIVLSLLCGVCTEEARALRWAHVDLDGDPAARPPAPPHVAVWRSVRTHGDTKTERSHAPSACPRWRSRRCARLWKARPASGSWPGTADTTPG